MADDVRGDIENVLANMKARLKKADAEGADTLLAAKDKPSREMGASLATRTAADLGMTSGGRRVGADGKPYGPKVEHLEEDDGIGGGTKVDAPMQPVGTERGRIAARNKAIVNVLRKNPYK